MTKEERQKYKELTKALPKILKDKTIINIDRDFKGNQITLKTTHQLESKDVLKISELIQSDFKVL